jgi:hypothetical protein
MKNSKRNRWAIIILIPIILLGLTLFFIQYHFESIVKNLIVTELNQNLLVKARASEIKFSVWENFPKASLSFIQHHRPRFWKLHHRTNKNKQCYGEPIRH